ncbi:MAG TPA: GAF domain-containing protein [Polyangiaceae bacterium]|nr:GAF domain-containing protein [Polyangiaceae bacterium]
MDSSEVGDISGVQIRSSDVTGIPMHAGEVGSWDRSKRDERLVRVTSAIAEAVSADQVYAAIVDLAGAAVGASSGGLWLGEDESGRANLVRAFGYSEAAIRRFGSAAFGETSRFPVLDAITRAEPVFIATREELHARYPNLSSFSGTAGGRVACFPVIVDGRTLGGLAFTFERSTENEEEERRFLTMAVRYSGQAIERLRLLGAEQRRRTRAESAAARMAILNRATRRFSESSTEVPVLLATVAEQIATESADACAVALFPDAEVGRRSAAYPEGAPVSELATVLSSGGTLPAGTEPSDHHVARLTARGRQIGVVCAIRALSRGAFTDEERALVDELAERAAVVMERALLYEASRRARERAELLYGLARVVIAAESAEQVHEAALDAIEQAVSAHRSAVLLCDADGVMRFCASRRLSEDYKARVEGHSPWARDARSPSPVLIPDVRRDPALVHLLPTIEAEGIRALGFIPLVADARLIGKFMVYYDQPHEFSVQELEMAGAIANHVASAIARLKALTELRETVHFNEMFTAILGHDLRNPLGAIMTAAQLAMKRYDDERLQKPLGRIMSSGQRMARMIDQLLDFTRVRVGGGLPLTPQPFDVLPLLRRIMDENERATPGFSMSLDAAGDTVGEWDADRLAQVFVNLIGNAAHHGTPGVGAKVRVDGTDPETVTIDVVNGGTIPRDLLTRLFDPMTGGEGRREHTQGLGLGLFITRQIINAHGGTIDAHSSEGGETVLHIALPRVTPRPSGLP